MVLDKSVRDTLELYLTIKLGPRVGKEYLEKFEERDDDFANKAIQLFETRMSMRREDIDRLFEKE
jgi:hypothetical protein